MNFIFHLKSKTDLVTFTKYNSHLQYNKNNLIFSINLQKINLNLCEEYKTQREAQRSHHALKCANDDNMPAKRTNVLLRI